MVHPVVQWFNFASQRMNRNASIHASRTAFANSLAFVFGCVEERFVNTFASHIVPSM
jgi:hypothetical protein